PGGSPLRAGHTAALERRQDNDAQTDPPRCRGGRCHGAGAGAAAASTSGPPAVTATVGVGNNPFGVAADALTGAVYVANFSDGAVSVITFNACTATITGTHTGSLSIGPGITCPAPGAVITGPVTITPGATALIQGAQLRGPLTAKGTAALAVCGTAISGNVDVKDATGPVLLGAGSACAPDTFGGSVSLTGNTT